MTLTGADICESVLWDEGEGSATKLWFLLSHLCRYQQGRGCDMEAEEQLCFICTGLSRKYIGTCFPPRNRCLLSHVTGLGHPSNQASFTSLCPVDRAVGSTYPALPSAHKRAKTDKQHLSPEQTLDTQYRLWKSGIT